MCFCQWTTFCLCSCVIPLPVGQRTIECSKSHYLFFSFQTHLRHDYLLSMLNYVNNKVLIILSHCVLSEFNCIACVELGSIPYYSPAFIFLLQSWSHQTGGRAMGKAFYRVSVIGTPWLTPGLVQMFPRVNMAKYRLWLSCLCELLGIFGMETCRHSF